MKKVLIIVSLLGLFGCQSTTRQMPYTEDNTEDSSCNEIVSIEETLKLLKFDEDSLTAEEIEYWDQMNNEGGCLYIRNAERALDTIVNHVRIVFIPKL